MIRWLLSNWSDSDVFKVGVSALAALVISILASNQRSRIASAGVALLVAAARVPVDAATSIGERVIHHARSDRLSRQRQQRERLQAGCTVSFVEDGPDDRQLVRKGRVAWIRNGTDAIIDWTPAFTPPFTGHLGPNGAVRTTHDADLLIKEHRQGDRGVVVDHSGHLLSNGGWSVLEWPPCEEPWWLRLLLNLDRRFHRRQQTTTDAFTPQPFTTPSGRPASGHVSQSRR